MATRKILFRGQVRRKGDRTSISGEPLPGVWVLGGVFPQNKGYDYAIIYQQEPKVEKYVVYAETVGQYTGIIDSIGTKVFEDDIITFWIRRDEAKIRLKGIVKYTESLACFTVSTSEPSGTDGFVQLKDCCGIHVIGNTFDGEFDKDEEELMCELHTMELSALMRIKSITITRNIISWHVQKISFGMWSVGCHDLSAL